MKAALRKLGTDEEIEAVIESIGKSAAPAKVGRYRDSDGVTRKVRLRGTLRGNVPVWVDDIEV